MFRKMESWIKVAFPDPIVYEVDFFLSKIVSFRLIKRDPLNFTVFDLVFDPVLDACELCAVFESFKTVHVIEVVP